MARNKNGKNWDLVINGSWLGLIRKTKLIFLQLITTYSSYSGVVLGKFGLKLIQTRFEPNRNQKFRFQFQDFVKIPDGSASGLGNP